MKRYPAQDLEPAVRDPKRLRITGLVLTVLILVSGFGILIAYNRSSKRQAGDDRPALGAGRLDKNFRVWRQDESEGGLLDMEGDVFVISAVSFEQPEGWKTTRKVLESLKERYGERSDFAPLSDGQGSAQRSGGSASRVEAGEGGSAPLRGRVTPQRHESTEGSGLLL